MRKARSKSRLGLNLVGKKTKGGLVCYTPGFKRFVRQNEGILRGAFKLVNKMNKNAFLSSQESKKFGITVSKEATGKYTGTGHKYKVEVAGRVFFVKAKKSPITALRILKGMKALDRLLKERNYKIGKFNVRIIKPLLLYERRGSERPYLVTRFFKKGEVEQAMYLDGKISKEVNQVLFSISQEIIRKNLNIGEIDPQNTFYQKATNTILLFDIQMKLKGS